MMTAQSAEQTEANRLDAVQRLRILDSEREERFDSITRLVCYILDVPMAAVSIVDDKRQWFKSSQGLATRETPRNVSFCDHTIRQSAVMEIKDAREDERFKSNPLVTGDPNIVFYAGYPLLSRDGYIVGALCAIDTRVRELDSQQKNAIKDLASIVQDQFALNDLAIKDDLTGLYNRRHIDSCVQQEWRRQARDAKPITLLFFDVDNFKYYNDAYGHPRGDLCLKNIADAASQQFDRAGDFIARYGGEEFMVLLSGTDIEGGRRQADALLNAIQALDIAHAPESDLPVVTISIGGATAIPTKNNAPDILIRRADKALFEAKRAGRNQVRWSEQ